MAILPKPTKEIRDEAEIRTRAEVLKAAKKKGVTLCKTMQRLNEALDAKETKFFQKDGLVVTQKDVVAHGIRIKAVEVALALHDAMPSQKHHVEHELAGSLMEYAVQAARKVKDEK